METLSALRMASRREYLRSGAMTLASAACGLCAGTAFPDEPTRIDESSLEVTPRVIRPGPADVRSPTIDLFFGEDAGIGMWWIPEHIMLGHTDNSIGVSGPVDWQRGSDDTWRYDHTNPDGRARISAAVSRIDLGWKGTVTVENRSSEVWNNVVAAICLLLPGSHAFADTS